MAKQSANDFFKSMRGSNSTATESADDFFEKIRTGQREEINTQGSQILKDTLQSVGISQPTPSLITPQSKDVTPYAVDFKADQTAKKSQTKPKTNFEQNFGDILPSASSVNTMETPIQTNLKGKVPAAELFRQTAGGPENASQIPGISQYEINKKEIEEDTAPEAVKAYAKIMNYITYGNPYGLAFSRAFAGNSGAARRDTTQFPVIDKVTDAINDFITPILVPSGAPINTGPNVGAYNVAGKALSNKPGQAVINTIAKGIEKVVPRVNPSTAQNIARQGLTETIAGPLQGVGVGLLNQQDSNEEIMRNALYGVAGGAVLGFGGAAAGEALAPILNRFRKSGIPENEIAEIAPELLALPEANPRTVRKQLAGEIKTSSSTDSIVTPYTPQLNAASPETQAASAARQASQSFDPVELNTRYAQEVIDEYKRLKDTNAKKISNKRLYDQARQNVDASRPTDTQLTTQKLKDTRVNGDSYYAGDPTIRSTEMTREQQLMNKVNAKQPLTQEDIDFALGPEWDNNKLFPESTPTESTYMKPRKDIRTNEELMMANEKYRVRNAISDLENNLAEGKISKSYFDERVNELGTGLERAYEATVVVNPTNKPSAKPVAAANSTKKINTTVNNKGAAGERRFAQTLRNSGKVPEAVQRMNTKYNPISNEGTLAQANKRIDRNMDTATKYVLREKVGATAESVTTAQRLIQEYTKAGDHETAALIAEKAASDLTNAGQTIQAASMWDRLSPEGMLLRVQREISKVNETLGPAEEKISLSAEDAAKITNKGEQLQGVQKVRDISQEVLDMVSSKKPGELLTADEKS